MKLCAVLALSLVICLGGLAQSQDFHTPPRPDDRLKADVLLIVAHPDDETAVAAYFAKLLDQGKRVAIAYLTHGEAGHNNMGTERGPSLGAAREMEVRHALTYLGVQNVWFLGGRDTPSQDVLQSLANWHHGQALEDVVRIVRITRPSVILSWMPGFFIGENHGDHQAAGVVATEAFDTAGDPSIFPAQLAQPRRVNETWLEGLQPWQPQKLYFFSDASDDKLFKGKGPSYPVTELSPKRNLLYWRVAMNEFRFHRTQYRSYIEKLEKMTDDQLAKVAGADQDGWATPLQLIFGKSLVPVATTGDVLEGIGAPPAGNELQPAAAPEDRGFKMSLGGPWEFYQNFRRAHRLEKLPQPDVAEIGVAAGTTLQVPLLLRNNTDKAVELSIQATVPEGWIAKQSKSNYRLSPGDVFPLQVELSVPASKSEKPANLEFLANSTGQTVGSVRLRVRVRSGGLPQ